MKDPNEIIEAHNRTRKKMKIAFIIIAALLFIAIIFSLIQSYLLTSGMPAFNGKWNMVLPDNYMKTAVFYNAEDTRGEKGYCISVYEESYVDTSLTYFDDYSSGENAEIEAQIEKIDSALLGFIPPVAGTENPLDMLYAADTSGVNRVVYEEADMPNMEKEYTWKMTENEENGHIEIFIYFPEDKVCYYYEELY